MEERRRFKRVPAGSIIWYELNDYARMQAGEDQRNVELGIPLESVDISLGGVQIRTDEPIEPEKRLKLILSVDACAPPISILARVVWTRPGAKKKDRFLGLEFLEFLNGRKKLLEDYINRSAA